MGTVRRIGEWIFSAKRHSTGVSPDRRTVYSFDLEGRPLSWYENDRAYKRSLASEVHGRERVGGRRRYFELTPDQAVARFESIRSAIEHVPTSELDGLLRRRLEQVLRWTPAALMAERVRFDAVYSAINILPPDQYLAVVLQATFGCSWSRCTFCNFFQDRPFRARSTDAFRRHAEAVRSFLGRGEKLRNGIFLADGNALVTANRRLRPLLAIAREVFAERPLSGFVDVFTGERKTVEEWVELREGGLRRVHVGLETGHDPLLRWMNKPATGEDARRLISSLEAAGLDVSTIVMVGAGGDRFAAQHVQDTIALIAELPQTEGDVVYLSPFLEHPGSEYARKARRDGVRPLDERATEEQYVVLRDSIRRAHPRVRVARYDIREFVY